MYYKIKDINLNLATAFERFQMAKFGNCIVLQSTLNTEDDAADLDREKETKVTEQHYLLTDDEL